MMMIIIIPNLLTGLLIRAYTTDVFHGRIHSAANWGNVPLIIYVCQPWIEHPELLPLVEQHDLRAQLITLWFTI